MISHVKTPSDLNEDHEEAQVITGSLDRLNHKAEHLSELRNQLIAHAILMLGDDIVHKKIDINMVKKDSEPRPFSVHTILDGLNDDFGKSIDDLSALIDLLQRRV